MLRRTRLLVPVAAIALAAPAGGRPAAAADEVATVNGAAITADELEDALAAVANGADSVSGDQARQVLSQLILNAVTRDALSDAGVDPDAGAADGDTFLDDWQRYQDLFADAGMVDLGEVGEEYEEAGQAAGQICMLLFTVADEEAGNEAMEQLADGTEFAAVAAEHDPGAATSGGSVTGNPDDPCVDAASLTEAATPIVDALGAAGAGTPAGPVETELGLVVVMAPPFDDVSTHFDDAAVSATVTDLIADLDVTVDPRYGRWDAAFGVVPLGTPSSSDGG